MELDSQHIEILQDIASFSGIERYRGMLPTKLALCHDERKINELMAAGLVERMEMSFACGQETVLLKLTESGEELVDSMAGNGSGVLSLARKPKREPIPKAPECQSISPAQWQIINDIFHFSKIHRFGGLMPSSEAEAFPPRELNQLFAQGFIIRVKSEIGSGRKRKGYILSDKGLRCLLPE